MKVARTIPDLRAELAPIRSDGKTIGFVPTMGGLHEGHLSLLRAARQAGDVVVLSIFVNPLQFGPHEDLAAYPRDEDRDLSLAAEWTDHAFIPSVDEMYPPGAMTTITMGEVATLLEGAARPGHFDGVATVVVKLFNIVQPDAAYFGQKDAQQLAVIRALTRDLSLGVDVVVCPTVREPDGLAMSSRNAYLTDDDRRAASVLWRALQGGRDSLVSGDPWEGVEKTMHDIVTTEERATLDYARAVDPDSFGSPREGSPVLLAVAARVGPARLIDNLLVDA